LFPIASGKERLDVRLKTTRTLGDYTSKLTRVGLNTKSPQPHFTAIVGLVNQV